MLGVETTRGRMWIEFQHIHPNVLPKKLGVSMKDWGKFTNEGDAGTYCLIKHDGVVVAQGRSIVHKDDKYKFNRDIGRKISLTNAVKSFSKVDRKTIWDAYLNRKANV